MKKIIIIDDDFFWLENIERICTGIGLLSFPSAKDRTEQNKLLAQIIRAFNVNDLDAITKVFSKIAEAIENNDSIFIIDYELFEGNANITGIKFYEKFCERKSAIFVSGSHDQSDIDNIQQFCNNNPQCLFISKREENFEQLLRKELTK